MGTPKRSMKKGPIAANTKPATNVVSTEGLGFKVGEITTLDASEFIQRGRRSKMQPVLELVTSMKVNQMLPLLPDSPATLADEASWAKWHGNVRAAVTRATKAITDRVFNVNRVKSGLVVSCTSPKAK